MRLPCKGGVDGGMKPHTVVTEASIPLPRNFVHHSHIQIAQKDCRAFKYILQYVVMIVDNYSADHWSAHAFPERVYGHGVSRHHSEDFPAFIASFINKI